MSVKFPVVGAIVGGIVLFMWGAVTHMLLPQPLHSFKDEGAVTQVIRANAPENGVYFSTRGVFASVALLPDLSDKAQNITPNLLRQLGTDTCAALLLCFVLRGLRGKSVLAGAGWLALVGFAAFLLKIVPYWNWYGFPSSFIAMEMLDLVGKLFLAGLVLGGLMKKLA